MLIYIYILQSQEGEGGVAIKWKDVVDPEHVKRPRIPGVGENIPSDCLRVLTEWTSVLEVRGTTPGVFSFVSRVMSVS